MSELCDLEAVELRRMIGNKEISPVELTESCINRTEAVNGALNAMVTPAYERARDEAKAAEKAVLDGDELGLLHGLPVGVKDLEATEGIRTTWGSLLYEDHVPDADQGSVAAFRAEGGIILGKTNTPEFGAGANTKNRVFGATGNPFDPTKTCGGSSGGSGVAVATGMTPIATGSDYGGSLRTPAGFCGVVGFRPSAGVVPSESKPNAQSPFSVLGPMGRTVSDAALLLAGLAGEDSRDPYSGPLDPMLLEPVCGADLSSVRAAISTDLGAVPIDSDIAATFKARTDSFRHLFAEAQDRDPDLGDVHRVFEVTRGVNFIAAHMERVETQRDLLGPNVIDNTTRGTEYSARDVGLAMKEQGVILRNFMALFDEVDVLIAPVCSVSPFPHDQLYVEEINGEKMATYMRWLSITYAPTMVHATACALPCGVDPLGMPFGIQVIGPRGADRFILEVAKSLEAALAANPETARPLPDIAKLAAQS